MLFNKVSKVIDVARTVRETLDEVAGSLPLSESAKKAVANRVEDKVGEKVDAVVVNATNNEPWYQSRVIIGTAVAITAMILRVVGVELDAVDQNDLSTLILELGAIGGSAYALYGRVTTKKPLGQ